MSDDNRRLGRGLGAIFGEDVNSVLEDIQKTQGDGRYPKEEIALSSIHPNPYQPRIHFDQDKIDELAQSITEHGVFTPVLLRKAVHGYQLIAGERRVRAAKQANLTTIPAIVMEFSEEEMMEISLIENIQRENLNVIEEANAYAMLIEKMDLTLEVSEAAVAELAKVGFDPVFGARPLKRAIQQRIENPLSKLLLEGRFPPKSVIPVDVDPVREPGVFKFDRVTG